MIDWNGTYKLEDYYNKTISLNSYPSFENLIQMQIAFYEWWKNAHSNFIIRGFSNYPRARIYKNRANIRFVSSDNEACVSFYEYTYHKGAYHFKKNLFKFYIENEMFISFPVQRDKVYEKESFICNAEDYSFRIGGAKGYPFRNEHQLKLSHYVDSAHNLNTTVTAKERCGIFLSPLNIILTPKMKRGLNGYIHKLKQNEAEIGLYKNDIGETKEALDFLHAFLIRDVLNYGNGEKAYQLYCEMCGLDFENQVNQNEQSILKANDYELEFIKPSKKNNKEVKKCKPNSKSKDIVSLSPNPDFMEFYNTRFYVTQKMYDDLVAYPDLDLKLNITPKKGNHPKGYYVIPNKIAREFIESKQGTPNWNNHKNFKQDGVPRDLTKYFSYK